MGTGIDTEFKFLFPEMFQEYRQLCYKGKLIPGDYFLYKGENKWVLNLVTQDSSQGAKIEYVQ